MCANAAGTCEYVVTKLLFPSIQLSCGRGGVELNCPAARKCFFLPFWILSVSRQF